MDNPFGIAPQIPGFTHFAVLLDTPPGHKIVTKIYGRPDQPSGGGTHLSGERSVITELLRTGQYVIEGGYPCMGECEERHPPCSVIAYTLAGTPFIVWTRTKPNMQLSAKDVVAWIGERMVVSPP